MNYPEVKGELETLAKLREGYSIARFGDQEFMLMLGLNAPISQANNQMLKLELNLIVQRSHPKCLIGVPTYDSRNPFTLGWETWREPFGSLLKTRQEYYSAFITRPDQCPWLNNPEFFDEIENLWRGKDVTLVANGLRSLTAEMLSTARSVNFVQCTFRDAYRQIDTLEHLCTQKGYPETVLMCAGPTATCLANRLAARGKQALDLGHIGRFWRRYDEIANWKNEREIDKTTGLVKENPHG